MVKFVKFKAEHVDEIKKTLTEESVGGYIAIDDCTALEALPYAFSVVNPFGKVIGCLGLVEYWKNRAEAWAFLTPECSKYAYSFHSQIYRFLRNCPIRRIEAAVASDIPRGAKWMRLLGFFVEAPCMPKYFPNGKSAALYSFIKELN